LRGAALAGRADDIEARIKKNAACRGMTAPTVLY
jgi:hypothetical protein